MKEALTQWLKHAAFAPGLLACGLWFPDESCHSHSNSTEFTVASLDDTWRQLAAGVANLRERRLAPGRLRWSFHYGDVHFAVRTDGTALGLVTTSDDLEQSQPLVDRLMREFLAS